MTLGRACSRANALPETALVVSLSLLLLFGAVQEAIFGFDQVSADGASFMGSQKAVALKGSSASLSDAQTVISMLFPRVKSSNVTIATSSGNQPLFETDVSEQVSTLALPGVPMPSSVTIASREIEPNAAATPSSSAGVPLLCYNVSGSNGGSSSTFNLGLSSILSSSTGQVNTTALSSHVATLLNLQTALGGLTTETTTLASDLVTLLDIPLVGPVIESALGLTGNTLSVVETYLTGQIETTLNASLAGTATSSQLSGLLSGPLGIVEGILGILDHSQLVALLNANSTLEATLSTINTSEATLNSITGTSGC